MFCNYAIFKAAHCRIHFLEQEKKSVQVFSFAKIEGICITCEVTNFDWGLNKKEHF